ncbi:MAG: hypothetical protein WBG48_00990 [Pricia sp.]
MYINSLSKILYIFKSSIFQILASLTLLCCSCVDSEKNNYPRTNGGTTTISQKNKNTTQEMIADIKEKIAEINVEDVPYVFNNAKVAILERKLKSARGNEKLNILFTYGLELLNTGKTDKCIEVLNRVLEGIESINVQSKSELIYYIKNSLPSLT